MIRCLSSLLGRRHVMLAAASVGMWILQTGCGSEVESPDPAVEGEVGARDPDQAVAFPGFACNTQHKQWVEVHGKNFTPLVLGTLEEGKQRIAWPKIRLTRVEDMQGEAVEDGRSVELKSTGVVLPEDEQGDGSGQMEQAIGMLSHDAGHDGGGDAGHDVGADAAGGDASGGDTGGGDTGGVDATAPDGGASDAGGDVAPGDAGQMDTAQTDTSGDAGQMDAGQMDAGGDVEGDTATSDAMADATGDVGAPDGGGSDAGAGDAGDEDVSAGDAGAEDAGMGDTPPERRVVWLDDTRLKFRISPELELEPGVYDITVVTAREPGGKAKEATAEGALGILGRPTVEMVEGKPYCVEQSARTLTVSGGPFLKDGEDLPTVYVGDRAFDPDMAGGCRTPKGPFGTYEICDSLTVTLPEGSYPPSTQSVRVENGKPAACTSLPEEDGSELRVVPAPTVFDIQPDPICSAQTTYDEVTITGRNFLRVPGAMGGGDMGGGDTGTGGMNGGDAGANGADTAMGGGDTGTGGMNGGDTDMNGNGMGGMTGGLPAVQIGDYSPSALTLEECQPVDGNVPEGTERCSVIKTTIPAGTLAAGPHQVTVTNPGAANCSTPQQVAVTSIDPPSIDSVGPQPIIAAQDADRLTITGQRFAIIDGVLPTVTVGSGDEATDYTPVAAEDCREVKGPGTRRVNLCETLEIRVGEGDFSVPDMEKSITEQLTVTNPAPLGCATAGEATAELTIFPPPQLSDVRLGEMNDEPICTVDGEREMRAVGSGFLFVEGRSPTVAVGMRGYQARPVGQACENVDIEQKGSLQVQRCETVKFTVGQGDFGDVVRPVEVFNPDPVGGMTADSGVTLTTVGEPKITELNPELVCLADGGTRKFTLKGHNFMKFRTMGPMGMGTERLPSLQLNGVSASVSIDAVPDADCTTIPGPDGTVSRCSTIEFTVTGTATGLGQLSVQNPLPASCTSATVPLTLDAAPKVTSADPLPTSTCTEANFRRIVVSGENFLSNAGELPEVTIGQKSYQPRAAQQCSPIPNVSHGTLEHCKELVVYADLADLNGTPPVEVTNPSPSPNQTTGCTSSNTVNLTRCP